MKKEHGGGFFPVNSNNKCLVPGYKEEIVRKAETLIEKEPSILGFYRCKKKKQTLKSIKMIPQNPMIQSCSICQHSTKFWDFFMPKILHFSIFLPNLVVNSSLFIHY